MQPDVLVDYLIEREETSAAVAAQLRRAKGQLDSILRSRSTSYHARLGRLYWSLDPDNDGRLPIAKAIPSDALAKSSGSQRLPASCADDQQSHQSRPVNEMLQLCDEILEEASYRLLSREEIEQCVGVASQWGVPLQVDFELFEHLSVYVRGDVLGTKLRRRWRRLYRPEPVDVPIYQRMFVLFQLRDDDDTHEDLLARSLHLRMFKNIPKQDIDMLLPGTKIRITKIDRMKIIVPSVGGVLMSIRKLAQFMLIFAAITFYSTAVLVGLILATGGYIVRSFFSYWQTKNRYMLNLTRNLYYQKLDTNAGAAYRAIEQAHRQTVNETLLAYYAIRSSDEPISARRLRRRCERMIREAIGVEIAFRVDNALAHLHQIGRIQSTPDERWVAKTDSQNDAGL